MEPVAAALHIRHAHKGQRLEAGIPEVAADAGRVVANTRDPQAGKTTVVVAVVDAVVAVAGRKQAGCTVTAVAQIARASVVTPLLPVPEPAAAGWDVVGEKPGVAGSRQQPPVMALVMTMPAWQAQRPVCTVWVQAWILRGRFRLPFWRKRTCPGQKMHCAFSQPLQLQRDAGANALQMHRLLRRLSPEAVRRPVLDFPHLLHLRPVRILAAQVPWRQIQGEEPSEQDLQPLSPHCEQPNSPTFAPVSMALPSWKSCRLLYRAGRANCRDYLVYYLIPDPSGSHQTLTSHRQVLRPR